MKIPSLINLIIYLTIYQTTLHTALATASEKTASPIPSIKHSSLPYYLLQTLEHSGKVQVVVIATVLDEQLLTVIKNLKTAALPTALETLLITHKSHNIPTKTFNSFDQLIFLKDIDLPYATIFLRQHKTLLLEKQISALVDFNQLSSELLKLVKGIP